MKKSIAEEPELAEKRVAAKKAKAAARRRRRACAKAVRLEQYDAFDVEWQMSLQADQDWYAGPEARNRALDRRRRLFLKHIADMEIRRKSDAFREAHPSQAVNWQAFLDVTNEFSD